MGIGVEAEIEGREYAAIGTSQHVLLKNRIRTHPLAQMRVVVSRAVVVEPRGDIELLAVEEVRHPGRVTAVDLVDPELAGGEILEVRDEVLNVVGQEVRAAEMIVVVVELADESYSATASSRSTEAATSSIRSSSRSVSVAASCGIRTTAPSLER